MIAGRLADQVRAWLMRPQIVHRLPGRLRLHIPALTHVDPTQKDWTRLCADILAGAAEIQSVEVNLPTGNVLIRYDSTQVTEEELIDFLQAVNRIVLRNWDRLVATPADELPEAVKRLVSAVRPHIRHRRTLDAETEISVDAST